jgi:hypothetical protein
MTYALQWNIELALAYVAPEQLINRVIGVALNVGLAIGIGNQ